MADEKTPRVSDDKVSGEKAGQDVEAADSGLNRALKSRHLQFIAIGGTIGTGLFLGTGSALAKAGPASLLIAFIFVGLVVYSVMVALAEMAAYMPVAGAFTVYATRFVDPTVGFTMGWIYWFSWTITYGLELVAAGLILQYWNETLNIALPIGIFWAVITGINFLPIRWFGEIEMWLSTIKIVTIVGFIVFSIAINAGAGRQGYIGFKYWTFPGSFAEGPFAEAVDGAAPERLVTGALGRFVGFWAVLITAGFSYQGSELVGVAAGDAADPEKTIPSAIRWTFWGIFSLFIATIFVLGLNIPFDNQELLNKSTNASASPFVIVCTLAGVQVLPHIINAVLLSAVLTAANSDVYSSSRILLALAEEGHAPAMLTKTNRHGTPYWSVAACASFGLLAFLNVSKDGETVFNWLLNITAVAGFITWSLINVCHLRFMSVLRHKAIPRASLPYRAPFQPYLSWFGLFFNVLILMTSGFTVFMDWDTSNFFAAYISLFLFVFLFIGHKLFYRTKLVALADADVSMGRALA
ncbi:hypothetical protein RJ55_07440 [Drechmeria coniospora]|nr:hypothetical protein RJ55_07440 [Drechmeria coniospora]